MNEPAYGGTGGWLNDADNFADLFVALPLAAVDPPDPTALLAIAHLRDTETNRRRSDYRPAWNGVLRLFNLLQFLPRGWWITHEGVKSNRYPDYPPTAEAPPQRPAPTTSAEWEEAMELAAAELHATMKQWAASGLPAPQVGYEMADSTGKVLAEAELAWLLHKVAVLLGDEADATAFEAAGWRVYSATDGSEIFERVVDGLSK